VRLHLHVALLAHPSRRSCAEPLFSLISLASGLVLLAIVASLPAIKLSREFLQSSNAHPAVHASMPMDATSPIMMTPVVVMLQ